VSNFGDQADRRSATELLCKKYKVFTVDPNWIFSNYRDSIHGAAASHYKCSTLEEIKQFPIGNYADKDCVLALWCTNPKLNEGIHLIESWGFTYVTAIPWIKIVAKELTLDVTEEVNNLVGKCKSIQQLEKKVLATIKMPPRRGIGHWHQSVNELLLIAKRGSPKRLTDKTETPLGLLTEEDRLFYHTIGKHSVKPEGVQSWLERSFAPPYCELYATRERLGWDCFGFNTGWKLTPRGIEEFHGENVSKSGHVME
jgi:site-specific DNA-methyltransferase (adenine-specific)